MYDIPYWLIVLYRKWTVGRRFGQPPNFVMPPPFAPYKTRYFSHDSTRAEASKVIVAFPDDSRLRMSKVQTLEARRTRYDLILCYKVLFGFVRGRSNPDKFFEIRVNTRGHLIKLWNFLIAVDLWLYFLLKARNLENMQLYRIIIIITRSDYF